MTELDLYFTAIHGESGAVDGLYVAAVESVERADPAVLYERMLDAAISLTGSDYASLQLFDAEREELCLIAHRGFAADAAAFWDRVGMESGTSCGKALERQQRVIVTDVEEAPFIRGTIDHRVYRDAGIRAMQTTPLVSRDRRLIGMMSTYWRRAHQPQAIELERFDLLARQVADVLAEAT
jgi:GAF domain-containing protein